MSLDAKIAFNSNTEIVESLETDTALLSDELILQLQGIIKDYIEKKSNRSINALSKKCNVSEPTLRRIMSGKIKTLPQVTTVLDILTYIAGTNSVRKIVELFPGAVADFLIEAMPHLKDFDQDYSNVINKELKDPIKYIIYKLSLNNYGVSEEKIIELYGKHGLQLLDEMISAGFISQDDSRLCKATVKSFSGSHADFVRNFKATSDFIKPEKYQNRKPLNPIFMNASDSINAEAYEQILRLQKSTQKKILKILASEEAKGSLPVFYLAAFDTLDSRGAREMEDL